MTEDFVFPGHYKTISILLTSYDGTKQVDMSNLIFSYTIEESINNDSIRGTAEVMDNTGLADNFPIRGEETLVITVEDALKKKRVYEMAVYKVSDVVIKDTNDGLRYKLHFVTKSRFDAGSRRIIRPFENLISDIAEIIFSSYYTGNKELLVEETEGSFRCVIPNYTPMQAMNFLASRAYSTKSPSCSFRFFETADNFYFVSDEFLINRALENQELIKEFTYSDAISNTGDKFVSRMQNLIRIENSDRVNTPIDLYSGAYKSNVIEIDFVKKTVEDVRFDYETEKNKFVTVLNNKETRDVHTDLFKQNYFTEENERRYLLFKDYSSIGDIPGQLRAEQHLSEITNRRISYRHHLNNTVVYAVAQGRLDLMAGDIIRLVIPEFSSAVDKVENKILSGVYLVSDCTNIFNMELHETQLKLLKYDWN
jgi:hypothetical protein